VEVQIKVTMVIDNLMTLHKNHKGIIHTTSYKQLNFIKENISQTNRPISLHVYYKKYVTNVTDVTDNY